MTRQNMQRAYSQPLAGPLCRRSMKSNIFLAKMLLLLKNRKIFYAVLIGLGLSLLLLNNSAVLARKSPAAGTTAIKMYDTVAYFTAGKAVKGSVSFTAHWHDMVWFFVSKENRDLFSQAPEKYAPQYDGYCAWAMSEGRRSITDPEVWRIVDGKLYLNCSKSAYEKWIGDIPGNIKKADANWHKIYDSN